MQVVDLSHTIAPDTPVYPGTDPPRLRRACTIPEHGFAETELTFFSHVGTHVDAPTHILPGAPTLDTLPVGQFLGPGCALDLADLDRPTIELEDLKLNESRIAEAHFVLLHTGWSRHWGHNEYFEGFPVLSEDAADWLSSFPLKGIGIDAISVDPVDTETFPIHKTFIEKGMIIVENLTRLEALGTQTFEFVCLPLKFAASDGAPTRAAAVVRETTNDSMGK